MSVWVIGGTSGTGKAIVETLKHNGGDGFIFATGEEVDVTDQSAIEQQMVDISDATTGEVEDPLQQVYFCAGVNYLQWVGQMDDAGLGNAQEVIDVNLMGFINVMNFLVKAWEDGLFDCESYHRLPINVCVISSDAANRPMRTSIAYCASKAGLNMAIRVAARELGPKGWRIWGIAPGMIENSEHLDINPYRSKMTDYIDQRVPEVRGWSADEAEMYEAQQAVVRNPLRIHPTDIADFAVPLNSPGNHSHVNGNIFPVNGGR
jgi:NAD(P)-dependent dehydrogenase (short-subunit alcohol dehydrogenase family)